MEITEVQIFPTRSRDGKLKAFATMTFDGWFVVRNVKIIKGNDELFVAMPSRKATENCRKCGNKNSLGSNYCNECGDKLTHSRAMNEPDKKKHMDIAHPITQECRVYIQKEVIKAYEEKTAQRSGQPAAGPERNARRAEGDVDMPGEAPRTEKDIEL